MTKRIFILLNSFILLFLLSVSCVTDDPDGDLISDKDIAVTDELLPDNDSEITDNLIDSDADTDQINDEDHDTAGTDDDTEFVDEIADLEDDEDIDIEPEICADLCRAGEISGDGTCTLWDDINKTWVENYSDTDDNLHNRARNYISLLREKLMPEGGIFRTQFTDSTYTDAIIHAGKRDSPIWTGIYLGSEALRYMVAKAPDAITQIDETVRVLDRWWRISGGRGYLARFAAPIDSTQEVLNMFDPLDSEDHMNVFFNGELWNWKGNVSRDQYQGAMFGFALAYEVAQNDETKEIIRSNVVNTVEQLMEKKTRPVKLIVDGIPMNVNLELQYIIPMKDTDVPEISITTSPFAMDDATFLNFWPNPPEYLRQVPGLSWLPDVYLRTQAIQLASMFRIALQVTDGIPEYAVRRQAILDHYNSRFDEWLDMADGWMDSNTCGASYY